MLAEFTFTPTESKYLIAKAVARLERVKNAYENGILAMHPSSSTFFISKELTGGFHKGQVWVTGTVVPKGLCVDSRTGAGTGELTKSLADPGKYPHTIVYSKGKPVTGWTLYDLIDNMGPGDIYIKGVNAMDSNRKVGVLLGSMVEGTIGKMVKASAEKGFEILCPTGYEKLIPGTVDEACAFINHPKDYSMGVMCSMFVFKPTVITEIDAFEILSGVKASVFSAGGLNCAEGAISIAVNGSEDEVNQAIEFAESVKGYDLPKVISPECISCKMPTCYIKGIKKQWVKED